MLLADEYFLITLSTLKYTKLCVDTANLEYRPAVSGSTDPNYMVYEADALIRGKLVMVRSRTLPTLSNLHAFNFS